MVLSRRAFFWCQFGATLLFPVLFFSLFFPRFQVTLVKGSSMEPTLRPFQIALASRTRTPQRGDIVLFHPFPDSNVTYVKRVIALPGDALTIHEGSVYVNGEALAEPYLRGAPTPGAFGPVLIPEGQMFVMGDNRANSLDSREFGPVPLERVSSVLLYNTF